MNTLATMEGFHMGATYEMFPTLDMIIVRLKMLH